MHVDDKSNQSLRSTILKNVVVALLLVGFTNALIFSGVGFSSSGTTGGSFIQPIPGWTIGVVWTVLFAGLGVVRGVMEANGSPAARRASLAVLVLIIACVMYPFYTLGLRNNLIGFVGNIATLGVAVWVAVRVGAISRFGVVAPLAVAGWLLFASAALLDGGQFLG